MDFIAFKAVVKALVLPPTGPLLMALCGLAWGVRHPRAGRRVAAAGIVLLIALSVPVVANMLTRMLEADGPFAVAQARDAQAVVVLGGGVRRDAPDYGGDTMSAATLERVRYGARVARITGLPVLVSGGSVLGGEPEGSLMRLALETEFGVPVRWAEIRSRTTHENAQMSAPLLRYAGISRVVLVVHAADMARASGEFADFGIDVVAAPTGMPPPSASDFRDFLPHIDGLVQSCHALYEMLALAVRAATPRAADQARGSPR